MNLTCIDRSDRNVSHRCRLDRSDRSIEPYNHDIVCLSVYLCLALCLCDHKIKRSMSCEVSAGSTSSFRPQSTPCLYQQHTSTVY